MTTSDRPDASLPSVESASAAAEPAADVTLNLDTLEREGAKGPFTFLHAGRRWMLADPAELDWKTLIIGLGDVRYLLRHVLPADDIDDFFATDMSVWKMRALSRRYEEHYGITSQGEAGALPG